MGDRSQQEDEILVLEAIYPEAVLKTSSHEALISIPALDACPRFDVQISFPPSWAYPSEVPPFVELRSGGYPDDSALDRLGAQLDAMFEKGEPVLIGWVSWLMEEWETLKPPPPPPIARDAAADPASELEAANLNSATSAAPSGPLHEIGAKIVHGAPLTERKSTFQAHCCAVRSVEEVILVMEALLANTKLRQASHNIMAYRIERAPGVFLQDCDDDGEQAAGGRLLHLLQMVDARNVVVVVSRWFGGILLGPARFGLINKAAAELLNEEGYVTRKI